MAIRVETSSDKCSVILGERFDFESVGPFRKAYEELNDLKGSVVVIDFSETRYIDSSALGMLINAKRYFDERSTKVRLTNTNEQIQKIFNISRFDKKFDIS